MPEPKRSSVKKFCLFCGQLPVEKNREHVIPRWLIRMTGEPSRRVYLGRKWTTPTLETREFSFDRFTFPACEVCNSRFATLESATQPIVEAMLASAPVSARQFDILLDWFDKIRIGLWLGMLYLNDNHFNVEPMFHIGSRIAAKDRLLAIYRVQEDGRTGVSWGATESPIFSHIPSCFTLMINGLEFVNASYEFMLAQRLGFPYPKARVAKSGGGEYVELLAGTGTLIAPPTGFRFPLGGVQVWQPIMPRSILRGDEEAVKAMYQLYDNQHVRSCCSDFAEGRGHVFRRDRATVVRYPDDASRLWIPHRVTDRDTLRRRTTIVSGEILESFMRNHADLSQLPEAERISAEQTVAGTIELHQTMLAGIVEGT